MVETNSHDFIASEIGANFVDAYLISNAEVVQLMKGNRSDKDKLVGAGVGLNMPQGINQIGDEMQRKTEQYVNKFNIFEQKDKVMVIRAEMQKFNEIPEIELILLWNLAPGSYEEAVTLIPQLKDRPEDAINHLIEFINKNKT
eukprot:403337994